MLHSVINYFATLPDSHRVVLLGITLLAFWVLENRQRWNLVYPRWRHALTNAQFTVVSGVVQFLIGILLIKELDWVDQHQWGLGQLFCWGDHPFLHFVIVFLLLDFLEYVYHVFMHRYANLWRFHAVHHADPHVDVSTVLREHPGETLIRLSFLLFFVLVSGTTFWALMARQVIQIVSNVVSHAHIRLSDKLDKILSFVLVTPNVHHVHHHLEQPYTDSNYGDVLTIWDRLFGTYRSMVVQDLHFGLDTHPEPIGGETFVNLLCQPFQEVNNKANETVFSPYSTGCE